MPNSPTSHDASRGRCHAHLREVAGRHRQNITHLHIAHSVQRHGDLAHNHLQSGFNTHDCIRKPRHGALGIFAIFAVLRRLRHFVVRMRENQHHFALARPLAHIDRETQHAVVRSIERQHQTAHIFGPGAKSEPFDQRALFCDIKSRRNSRQQCVDQWCTHRRVGPCHGPGCPVVFAHLPQGLLLDNPTHKDWIEHDGGARACWSVQHHQQRIIVEHVGKRIDIHVLNNGADHRHRQIQNGISHPAKGQSHPLLQGNRARLMMRAPCACKSLQRIGWRLVVHTLSYEWPGRARRINAHWLPMALGPRRLT